MDTYQPMPSHVPVVVVGAGYAGLSAALELTDAGTPCLVVESADRVGGRTLTEQRDVVIDHGGQWVGRTQHHLLALAERFSCPTFHTYETGWHLERWSDGSLARYTGAAPEAAAGIAEYWEVAGRLDELAATIDIDDPTSSPHLEEWDSVTVRSWFDRTVVSPDARRRLDLAVQGVWSTEARDISVFHLLFYIASAGSFEQLMETDGCAQERRFHRGAQSPALAVAEQLGDAVRTSVTVLAMEQDDNGVDVHTDAGDVRAQWVIVATPPPATARIRFRPPLPVDRARWLQRSTMGDVAKVHVVYEAPFWRAEGLSGVATLYGEGSVGVVFDNSPDDASVGVLVAFIYGDRLRSWSASDQEARRQHVLETLTRLYGERAGAPRDYVEKNWPEDAYARGGYTANPAPGAWFEHGARGWRTPVGRIHWAGSETASRWYGYIDGAISSGQRAAHEVLDQEVPS
ncbi:flavin monoamine oxidase family protein [Blastococcus goldschmidtiae]|uniref:FAD-dependent oxidoreductase n=1 Tax=Blastococcus goldschmidtiae TaxID=3075546 RepID=A0ABU2K6V6_9ACTN|nr:FAD-dependent oxidoreductase [Blastococcus sp. DSM 46792]MDT0275914.1 FAD-dependent oxidoreductase [Blastococcus sp. DSM 46792]